MQPLLQNKLNSTAGILFGAGVSIAFIAFATIGAELYVPFKDWLAAVFSHHWIGKGILAMAIFIIASLSFKKRQTAIADIASLSVVLFWVLLLSVIAISGFFWYETFIPLEAGGYSMVSVTQR